MSPPLFSVVIPTCDRPHLLQHTLKAALNVDYDNYEIVVSDNFSGPETAELVARLGNDKVRYFRTSERIHMPDNWQHGYDRSTGDYVIIVGDDDGIVTHALSKLEQIIRATGRELITWRNFGYYHPDWPSALRNNVMLGRVTKNLNIISSAYMLRKTNRLEHPAMFNFPHGSRFCFSRRVGEAVRRRCGRLFDVPYPDFTSSLYVLATLADSSYAYYDGPVTFTTYSYNSNSAIILPRQKRNTSRAKAFFNEFSEPMYQHTPLKSNLIWNGHAECVLRMRHHFALASAIGEFDYANYFLTCYKSIVADDLSDVLRSRAELLAEFAQVLGEQEPAVRAQFERLKIEDQARRHSLRPRKGFIRDVAMNLPRGLKESVKANNFVRRVAETLTGSRIAVSGADHGFSNLEELCACLERLTGEEEPFMQHAQRSAPMPSQETV